MTRPPTVVTDPPPIRVLLWTALPALGLAAGWLLPRVLAWATSRPGLPPLPGPLRLLAELPEPYVTVGTMLAGAAAGLALAHRAAAESLVLTVTDRHVLLRRENTVQEARRADVAAVFLDRDRLVLLDHDGRELAAAPCEAYHTRVARAFTDHGYPWRPDGDPYDSRYRRWVPDAAGLPTGADALFKARARALARGDHADAADLRAELARLGVVVRDRDRRQYWRRVEPPLR